MDTDRNANNTFYPAPQSQSAVRLIEIVLFELFDFDRIKLLEFQRH